MKVHEILEDEKFKRELHDAFARIKVRKSGGRSSVPHENRKKKLKQGYEKHKDSKIDYYA